MTRIESKLDCLSLKQHTLVKICEVKVSAVLLKNNYKVARFKLNGGSTKFAISRINAKEHKSNDDRCFNSSKNCCSNVNEKTKNRSYGSNTTGRYLDSSTIHFEINQMKISIVSNIFIVRHRTEQVINDGNTHQSRMLV
ncbi:unnamed protein product [Adineta ricciae]|uniref:Uncharacterized protein n=1 Tax=Adineta ricciae TaxID=249248 RepID=A0A813Y9V3_ADIRI|nr:unnamed protein product [Adineta ricciae]